MEGWMKERLDVRSPQWAARLSPETLNPVNCERSEPAEVGRS